MTPFQLYPFQLYLVRHGIAEDFDPQTMERDADRALTAEGRSKMAAQARGLTALELGVAHVFASPYKRAQETAEIIAKRLKPKPEVVTTDTLVPHAHVERVIALLAGHRLEGAVMLVGHEPHLSTLAGWAFAGKAHAAIELKKGGMIGIDVHRLDAAPIGALTCALPPRVLRAITE